MKGNISADSSFYICNAFNLKRTDLLINYLDLYQFYAGPIIFDNEITDIFIQHPEIRKKITRVESPYSTAYTDLFKILSPRKKEHIEEDGEYEAIGLAIELTLTKSLHSLIIDDNGPKNFAKIQIANLFPDLHGKIRGTVGFIRYCYVNDSVITKEQCIAHLTAIYERFLAYQIHGEIRRPCSMDAKFVKNTLLPLIKELEQTDE